MDSRIPNLLIVISLIGVLFLGNGITGMIVIDNCCAAGTCDDMGQCKEKRESVLDSTFYFYLGILCIVAAITIYLIISMKKV